MQTSVIAKNTPNQKDGASTTTNTTRATGNILKGLSRAFGNVLPQSQQFILGDQTWVSGPYTGTIVSMHRQTYGFISAQLVCPFDIYFACNDIESTTRHRLQPGTVVEFDLHCISRDRFNKPHRRGFRALVRSKVKTSSKESRKNVNGETIWERRTYRAVTKAKDSDVRKTRGKLVNPACPIYVGRSVRYAKGPKGQGFLFERNVC
jgi:hypothetical protein